MRLPLTIISIKTYWNKVIDYTVINISRIYRQLYWRFIVDLCEHWRNYLLQYDRHDINVFVLTNSWNMMLGTLITYLPFLKWRSISKDRKTLADIFYVRLIQCFEIALPLPIYAQHKFVSWSRSVTLIPIWYSYYMEI